MKMIKIISMAMFGLMLQMVLALPALAASDDMKADMKMKDNKAGMMMNSDKPGETMMKPDAVQDKKMVPASMSAMLTGAEGHKAVGKVGFAQEMGKDLLVLSDIKVDQVPDGHVYLAKQGDRKNGVDLGILSRFSGKVSFALPEGTDPQTYDSVIIYCEKFDVEIGRAVFGEKM